jgi:hypothetical protein
MAYYKKHDSILSDKNIDQMVSDTMLNALGKTLLFSQEGQHHQRSTGKTSIFHQGFESSLLISLGDYRCAFAEEFEFFTEGKHAGSKGTSRKSTGAENSDIVIKEKKSGKIFAILPLKAPLYSLNKNCSNTVNAVRGGICNIFISNPESFVCAITFYPTLNPTKKSDKNNWLDDILIFNKTKYPASILENGRFHPKFKAIFNENVFNNTCNFYAKYSYNIEPPRQCNQEYFNNSIKKQSEIGPIFKNLDTTVFHVLTERILVRLWNLGNKELKFDLEESHPEIFRIYND